MNNYGAYIWPCYAVTIAVLIWNVWSARRRLREEILHAKRRSQAQREMQS